MSEAWINRIGTAVPPHDMHRAFVDGGLRALAGDRRGQALFERMAAMSGILHRYAIFGPAPEPGPGLDSEGFYALGAFPSTARRMERFQRPALELALRAVEALELGAERSRVTHLIAASCTGFAAPGLDFQIMQSAGLAPDVERTMIGFMGCFAAVSALRSARHIVRSDPKARVLVVNLELCSLHLQEEWRLEKMLSFLLFGDGASAALVSAEPAGLRLDRFRTEVLPGTEGLITWEIGDHGFEMHLSGKVPGEIRRFLKESGAAFLDRIGVPEPASWAVHAGGRTILDAVQDGFGLPLGALLASRAVLRDFGNMSSATLMFVLRRIMAAGPPPGPGLAIAFGPGLTIESFAFSPGRC